MNLGISCSAVRGPARVITRQRPSDRVGLNDLVSARAETERIVAGRLEIN